MKKRLAALLLCLAILSPLACKKATKTDFDNKNNAHFQSEYKNYKGFTIPTEWIDRQPSSKEKSLQIYEGDSFDKAIDLLGIPFQDSGKDKNIWHYRLDDGTYVQLIGTEKIEKIAARKRRKNN